MDSDLRFITPEWIDLLSRPVLRALETKEMFAPEVDDRIESLSATSAELKRYLEQRWRGDSNCAAPVEAAAAPGRQTMEARS